MLAQQLKKNKRTDIEVLCQNGFSRKYSSSLSLIQ